MLNVLDSLTATSLAYEATIFMLFVFVNGFGGYIVWQFLKIIFRDDVDMKPNSRKGGQSSAPNIKL